MGGIRQPKGNFLFSIAPDSLCFEFKRWRIMFMLSYVMFDKIGIRIKSQLLRSFTTILQEKWMTSLTDWLHSLSPFQPLIISVTSFPKTRSVQQQTLYGVMMTRKCVPAYTVETHKRYTVYYNRARPTLLIKERRQHSYDTYDYDSTEIHNRRSRHSIMTIISLWLVPR